MKKCLLFLVCTLVLILLCGCGEAADTGLPVDTEPGCAHVAKENTVKITESTCDAEGSRTYVCEICGENVKEVLPKKPHDLYADTDAKAEVDFVKCWICGETYYPVDAGKTMNFSATCRGDVRALFKGTVSDLVVDGKNVDIVTDADGKVTLATNLPRGFHTFSVKNSGSSELQVCDLELDGRLTRRGAVIVEVLPAEKDMEYSSFNMYVMTSHESEEYYVRYKFTYTNSTERLSFGADTGTNRDLYRINSAQLCKVTNVTDTKVEATDVYNVLKNGEVSLAIKQAGVNYDQLSEDGRAYAEKNNITNYAGDFIGGFHGDEIFDFFELTLDGETIDLKKRSKGETYPGTYARFEENTTLYAWGTSTKDDPGRAVARHYQDYIIDSKGVDNIQSVEWLVDGFKLNTSATYLQMFTMVRKSGIELIAEEAETRDEKGRLIAKETLDMDVDKDENHLSDPRNREVRYSGKRSGVSANCGFKIIDDSVAVSNARVQVRQYNDNKWYASFKSVENGDTPKKGEVWEIEAYFDIDYKG